MKITSYNQFKEYLFDVLTSFKINSVRDHFGKVSTADEMRFLADSVYMKISADDDIVAEHESPRYQSLDRERSSYPVFLVWALFVEEDMFMRHYNFQLFALSEHVETTLLSVNNHAVKRSVESFVACTLGTIVVVLAPLYFLDHAGDAHGWLSQQFDSWWFIAIASALYLMSGFALVVSINEHIRNEGWRLVVGQVIRFVHTLKSCVDDYGYSPASNSYEGPQGSAPENNATEDLKGQCL